MKESGISGARRLSLILLLFMAINIRTRPEENEPLNTMTAAAGHRGAVNTLLYDGENRILSAGEDGFLTIWDIRQNMASSRFQLSPYGIRSMVLRPGKTQLTLIESDDLGLYRISVWDYAAKQKLFTLRFRDSVSYINYSGGGNFLIAARSGRTGVVFIHPETGELLNSPADLTGPVGFAATGMSERTMLAYLSSGALSYWNLESGTEISHVPVPANMSSPLLFGNNRFFGGIDTQGLAVLDAVSGALLFREQGISPGTLFSAGPSAAGFFCLAGESGTQTLYYFGINGGGTLEIKGSVRIPPAIRDITAGAGEEAAGTAALGTGDGRVWTLSQNGSPRSMAVRYQRRILEAAVSRSSLAFLDTENSLAFIPRDYTLFKNNDALRIERGEGYTRIASDPESYGGGPERFLLWQGENTRTFPVLRTAGNVFVLDKLPLRFPIISAALLGEKALFLDFTGNITVLSAITGDVIFSFSSRGSLDAAFLDGENIILGRGALTGSTPFLAVNIETGETLPITYPSAIGAKVYRGSGGIIYGAAIDQEPGNPKTAIVCINPSNPSLLTRLIEYQGEDTLFDIAESEGILASTLGGDGATLYGPGGIYALERGPGLPVRLIEDGNYFIALDNEGNISWHDPQSGKLLALFRLYDDEWILERPGTSPLRGPVVFNGDR
jgi:WD40 repeat protein